ALEFRDTKFALALYYVDFCRLCLHTDRSDLARSINASLGHAPDQPTRKQKQAAVDSQDHELSADGWDDEDDYDSYVNTDVGSSYQLVPASGAVTINGDIVRFYWRHVRDHHSSDVEIAKATQLTTPSQLEAIIAEQQKKYDANGLGLTATAQREMRD